MSSQVREWLPEAWILSEANVKALFRATDLCRAGNRRRNRAILALGAFVGMRVSEVASLRREHLRRLDKGSVLYWPRAKKLRRVRCTPSEAKARSRNPNIKNPAFKLERFPVAERPTSEIKVGPKVREAILLYVKNDLPPGEEWVFPGVDGPISIRALQRQFGRLCVSAKIGEKRFHALRYFRARSLYAKHKDINRVRREMGHADLQTSLLYVRPTEQEVEKEVEADDIPFDV